MRAPISSLYVHVPFCAHKCEYCAFYSHAPSGEVVNRYVNAVVRELEMVAGALKPATVFFGGGTPSLLNLRQWETILKAMQRLDLLGAGEWSVECNPATISLDKAMLLRSFGVNRISMGVQTLDERLLERLGRIHSREMVFKSFDVLRQAGFENINLDLMFAIPGQSMETWRATLAETAAMGSEHLSSYEVIYEDDTPLYEQLKAGQFEVDEELACAMFEELVEFTAGRGYRQYEIANFALDKRPPDTEGSDLPSRACLHNVNYWRGGEFAGVGPSASEYSQGVRTKNWSNTTLYCELVEKGERAIESKDVLSPISRAGEIAGLGLRMNAGWPLAEFRRRTGFELETEWANEIRQLTDIGYANFGNGRFNLTPLGLRYADWAAELFLRTAGEVAAKS